MHKYKGTTNPASLGWTLGWPHKNKLPPHMCYHIKLCSSALKGVCINRRESKKTRSAGSRPLRQERGLPPRNTPLPHTCYPAEICRSTSNGTGVDKEIRLKIWFLTFSLSRSLGHRKRHGSIRRLRLPINVTSQPWTYLVQFPWDKRRFQSKIVTFPHPRVFCDPAEGIGYRHLDLKK